MTRTPRKLAIVSSDVADAREAATRLIARYGQADIAAADVVVALGGDGFMLQTLRETMSTGRKVYGMNRGTVGFLMNDYAPDGLVERLEKAERVKIRPLVAQCETISGKKVTERAFNEVSLLRQTAQSARLLAVNS